MGTEVIFIIIIIIISVVIHEVSHGFVADMLGDPTARLQGRLSLNPTKHLDPVGSFVVPLVAYALAGFAIGWAKPVPYNPYNLKAGKWGPAIVAAAGPASNFLIAIIFGLIIRFTGGSFSQSFIDLSVLVVLYNVLLAVFNLVPVPPLDGSKILFALLPYHLRGVAEFMQRNSLLLVLFVIFFSILSGKNLTRNFMFIIKASRSRMEFWRMPLVLMHL